MTTTHVPGAGSNGQRPMASSAARTGHDAGNVIAPAEPVPAPPRGPRPRRLCRTPEEIDAAAREDARNDPPLTPSQRTRIAALLGPSIRAYRAQNHTKSA